MDEQWLHEHRCMIMHEFMAFSSTTGQHRSGDCRTYIFWSSYCDSFRSSWWQALWFSVIMRGTNLSRHKQSPKGFSVHSTTNARALFGAGSLTRGLFSFKFSGSLHLETAPCTYRKITFPCFRSKILFDLRNSSLKSNVALLFSVLLLYILDPGQHSLVSNNQRQQRPMAFCPSGYCC